MTTLSLNHIHERLSAICWFLVFVDFAQAIAYAPKKCNPHLCKSFVSGESPIHLIGIDMAGNLSLYDSTFCGFSVPFLTKFELDEHKLDLTGSAPRYIDQHCVQNELNFQGNISNAFYLKWPHDNTRARFFLNGYIGTVAIQTKSNGSTVTNYQWNVNAPGTMGIVTGTLPYALTVSSNVLFSSLNKPPFYGLTVEKTHDGRTGCGCLFAADFIIDKQDHNLGAKRFSLAITNLKQCKCFGAPIRRGFAYEKWMYAILTNNNVAILRRTKQSNGSFGLRHIFTRSLKEFLVCPDVDESTARSGILEFSTVTETPETTQKSTKGNKGFFKFWISILLVIVPLPLLGILVWYYMCRSKSGKWRPDKSYKSVIPTDERTSQLTSVKPNHRLLASPFLEQPSTKQFGVSLKLLRAQNGGDPIAPIIKNCVRYLQQTKCLNIAGIFRKAASVSVVKMIQVQANEGQEIDFEALETTNGLESTVNAAVDTIKAFLRQLADPLLTYALYDEIIAFRQLPNGPEKLSTAMNLINVRLPEPNYQLFRYLVTLLVKVTDHAEANKMDASNLSKVCGPSFARSKETVPSADAFPAINHFIEFTLLHYKHIFPKPASSLDQTGAITLKSTTA